MPSYSWNPANRNYYSGDTRVARSTIRGWIDTANSNLQDKLRSIGQDYVSGKINSAQAEIDATDLITAHHSAIAVIANGGRDQMDARAWGTLGPVVKDQRGWLSDAFRANANEELSDERLAARLESYATAGSRTFENLSFAYARAAGFDEVFNILGDSKESCDECPALTAAGPMPASEMPEIGDRSCDIGCNCEIGIVGVDDVDDN